MSKIKQDASKAKRELELTKEAFDAIRAAAIKKMIGADLAHGDAVRARMAMLVQAVDQVRDILNAYLDSASIEDANHEIRRLMETENG